MDTTVNPIVEKKDGVELRKYDLDDGVYFHEEEGENNRENIDTWHDWVYKAVKDHTETDPIRKNTCVRVIFSDGHHIDLPLYYKNGDIPELAHRSKGWKNSNPVLFTDWFHARKSGTTTVTAAIVARCCWGKPQFRSVGSVFFLMLLVVVVIINITTPMVIIAIVSNHDKARRRCDVQTLLLLPTFRAVRQTRDDASSWSYPRQEAGWHGLASPS